jgi:hypothetical protein
MVRVGIRQTCLVENQYGNQQNKEVGQAWFFYVIVVQQEPNVLHAGTIL